MSGFAQIDMSRLPVPEVVEPFDYETLLSEWKTAFSGENAPEWARDLALESEPVVKLMEAAAYREMLLRQRINDAAKSVMLAYATDGDLDHLAALVGVKRKRVKAGDPDATPPVEDEMEVDAVFRRRIQMALRSVSVAGPAAAYRFHAMSVEGCKDASVDSPSPCEVVVTILGDTEDGEVTDALKETVETLLEDGSIRPLTDRVTVKKADILTFEVTATLHLGSGPGSETAMAAAKKAVREYVDSRHWLGETISRSGLLAALHQPGVRTVVLTEPSEDRIVNPDQAAYCKKILLKEVRDEPASAQ